MIIGDELSWKNKGMKRRHDKINQKKEQWKREEEEAEGEVIRKIK